MLDWATVQRGIFGGESGGDYSALYNYQNRPGGLFQNTDVTKMTIDQLVDFTNPGGDYGRYVKKTNPEGVLSTPIGAYQVVGTTLKDAVKALNISGDQIFDKATQDRIGRWIYKTQGTGAWQGYQAQTQPLAAPGIRGALNMQPQQNTNGKVQPMQQRPQTQQNGLLGFFKNQNPSTGLTKAQQFAAALDPLIMPSMRGGESIRAQGQQRVKQKTNNATAAYLRANGMGDVADMMEAGNIDGSAVTSALMQARMSTPKQSSKIQNYKYAKEVLNLPEAEALKFASSGTSIDMSNNELAPFAKEGQKRLATLFSDLSASGQSSKVALGQTQVLEQLLQQSDTGFGAGLQQWAKDTFNIDTRSEPAAAAQAIIAQLVPQQRAPGSGTMSDADLTLYKSSLPSISTSPGGNQLIIQSMKAIAQYNVEVGKLADRALYDPEYTPQMAKEAMNQLPDPLAPVMAFIKGNNITPTKGKEFTQDQINAYETLGLPLPGSN